MEDALKEFMKNTKENYVFYECSATFRMNRIKAPSNCHFEPFSTFPNALIGPIHSIIEKKTFKSNARRPTDFVTVMADHQYVDVSD